MNINEDAKRRSRWRHDGELKRQVLAECAVPGASVAMAHGLNANLVHKPRRAVPSPVKAATAFVPVALAAPTVVGAPAQHIELELHRVALSVRVRWPMAVAEIASVELEVEA